LKHRTSVIVLTPAQSRAARALLDMPRPRLAELSGVSHATLSAFEGGRQVKPATQQRIRRALEIRGIEFIDTTGVRQPISAATDSLYVSGDPSQ
jgi:transcriptional regulator with XRE-family HTH domain